MSTSPLDNAAHSELLGASERPACAPRTQLCRLPIAILLALVLLLAFLSGLLLLAGLGDLNGLLFGFLVAVWSVSLLRIVMFHSRLLFLVLHL
jgi:hypothetical protein